MDLPNSLLEAWQQYYHKMYANSKEYPKLSDGAVEHFRLAFYAGCVAGFTVIQTGMYVGKNPFSSMEDLMLELKQFATELTGDNLNKM